MSNKRDKDKAPARVNVTLAFAGNSSVGKSSLLLRLSSGEWYEAVNPTTGVDFRTHRMDIKGKRVKLSIWDTAGMERYRTITPTYYRRAQGVILVYDVTNRESFDALPKWLADIEKYAPSGYVKIIVGNKVDMEDSREVSISEGQAFATRMNALFIEASAKTDVGVQEAFHGVVERIIDTPELWPSSDAARKSKSGPESAGPESAVVQVRSGSIKLLEGPPGEAKPQGGGGCGC